MDLLFKRYASPFTLVDQMILAQQFSDFIHDLYETVDDEKLWDIYLHKVNSNESFNEFKESIRGSQEAVEPINFETTINDSYDILQGFVPE